MNETIEKRCQFAARNQIFTDIAVESMMASRKSISPRMKLLKKTMKG